MRRIVKGSEPVALQQWKVDNQELPQNLRYRALHGTETQAIRLQMLLEQGYICAYTMQRIEAINDCHIEHLVPQNQNDATDLDYDNMLACFPGTKSPPEWNPKFPYGAQQKSGTHINANNFISPLTVDVEDRFQYTADGLVQAAANDAAALSTIRILKLNHSSLCELRKAAIEARVLDASLSVDEAIQLASSICSSNSDGMLPEFCLAIAQVSDWYARALQAVQDRARDGELR